jgi:mitochondrial fission protein ELM1
MAESRHTDRPESVPRAWLLQGKMTGDNAQVLALGDSLRESGWDCVPKPISATLRASAKHQRVRLPAEAVFADSGLAAPWPDLVIACGSAPCIVAQWIKTLSGDRTLHVQLGRLGARPEAIDLILETAQYGIAPTPNMMALTLPIARRDPQRQAEAIRAWLPQLADLPRPWLGVLVGGPSSPIPFDAADGSRLLRRVVELRRELGGSALIAYGPRTPLAVQEILELGLKQPGETSAGDSAHRVFGWPPVDPNPYPALLAVADRFLVTFDSASMIADACVTGKPVEVFPLKHPDYLSRFSSRGLGLSIDARRRRRAREGRPPDTLDRLRDALVTRRWLTPYRDMRDLLHALNKAGVVGSLGDAIDGTGKALQEREIAAVKARIETLMQDRKAR